MNEDLIIQAAKSSGAFSEVKEGAPTGACKFPLFVLEISTEMDIVDVIDPLNTRYDVDEMFTVTMATRAEPGKERAAKVKLQVLLKSFLKSLNDAVPDNTKFRLREFERFFFVVGGKHAMIGRAEISRMACFDLDD